MASSHIEHRGTVVEVADKKVEVEIVNQSACASCKAKMMCTLSDGKEKRLTIPVEKGPMWRVGEEVVVSLRMSLGFKAVFLMYVLPLILLLTVLFTLTYLHVSELFTGIAALVAPLLCYYFVWLFRGRIEKEYIFAIKKLN